MEDKTTEYKHRPHDFLFYPTNKVVGFVDHPKEVHAVLDDLKTAGFNSENVEVLTGDEGLHRIDRTGKEHGLLARLVRALEYAGDMEPEHLKRHEEEMKAGHFAIGVTAKAPEDREEVRHILKAHDGHFINFYGRWAIEMMNP